jgi:hypothetical protein
MAAIVILCAMDDIAQQLARRDRVRRHYWQSLTHEQRLDEMSRLQARAWAILRSNPDGYAHFMRRNMKARAIPTNKKNGQ